MHLTGEKQIIDDVFKSFINEMKNISDKNEDEIALLECNWLEFWIKIIDQKDYQNYQAEINNINCNLFPELNLDQPLKIVSSSLNSEETKSKSIKPPNMKTFNRIASKKEMPENLLNSNS